MELLQSGAAPESSTLMTLDEVKQYMGIDHDDEDVMLGLFIEAVYMQLDGPHSIIGRSLAVQSLEFRLDGFPSVRGAIRLPHPPVRSVTSVTYQDIDGNAQTLGIHTDFLLYRKNGRTWLIPAYNQNWPATEEGKVDAVSIIYQAGEENIPPSIKVAGMMMVQDLYDKREMIETFPNFSQAAPSIYASLTSTSARENPTIYRLLGPYNMKRMTE